MWASKRFHKEIVKILEEQEEIDINNKDICWFYLKFILVI